MRLDRPLPPNSVIGILGGGQLGRGVADSEYGGGTSDEGKPEPEAAAPAAPWSVQPSPTAIRALDHRTKSPPPSPNSSPPPCRPIPTASPNRCATSCQAGGDYRITFRILEDDRVLFIGRIEHRAHVYRRQ